MVLHDADVASDTSARLYRLVGRGVRERRGHLEITQEELGERCGLSRTSVTNLERGRQKVPLHQLQRIADVLDVDLRDLLPSREELRQVGERISVVVDGKTVEAQPATAQFIQRVLAEETHHGVDQER